MKTIQISKTSSSAIYGVSFQILLERFYQPTCCTSCVSISLSFFRSYFHFWDLFYFQMILICQPPHFAISFYTFALSIKSETNDCPDKASFLSNWNDTTNFCWYFVPSFIFSAISYGSFNLIFFPANDGNVAIRYQ